MQLKKEQYKIFFNISNFIYICPVYNQPDIIPFSNDTKDTGSMSFLSLPQLAAVSNISLSLSHLRKFLIRERERYIKVNLRCVDNNRCSAAAHITQLRFHLIIFFSRSFLEIGSGRRVASHVSTMLFTTKLSK